MKVLVREAFRSTFKVKFDRDFRTRESACKEDVRAYDASANTGPDIHDPKIDFHSKKLSRWNQKIIDLVFDRVPDSQKMSPKEKEEYNQKVIKLSIL